VWLMEGLPEIDRLLGLDGLSLGYTKRQLDYL
jgi:hypothetical protein